MITVEVRPFVGIKAIIGRPTLKLEVSEGTTITGVIDRLIEIHGPELKNALIDPASGDLNPHYMLLLNGKMINRLHTWTDTVLNDGDVLSIMMYFAAGG